MPRAIVSTRQPGHCSTWRRVTRRSRNSASAWLEYNEALTLARRDQRDDRVRYAQERLAAVEPKLARLTVTVAADADIPELEVKVDDATIRAAARGVPTPVDPGSTLVSAARPVAKRGRNESTSARVQRT